MKRFLIAIASGEFVTGGEAGAERPMMTLCRRRLFGSTSGAV